MDKTIIVLAISFTIITAIAYKFNLSSLEKELDRIKEVK